MRRGAPKTLLAAVTVTAAAAACSQTVTGSAQRADPDTAEMNRSYGYVDDRCGLLDDSAVLETLEATEVARPYSGAVCQYILSRRSGSGAASTLDVTFSWFETGDLHRERELADARGAVITDTVLDRHQAFTARRDTTGAACSVTAAAGTGVLSWWVQLRGQNGGDPCLDAQKLMSATLQSEM
ncbi:MAG: DUF3558 domain-containing protein [Actinomycetota bacterium]|nr:DUF3558 domain-containing protein [Actinomycetota bacterium]